MDGLPNSLVDQDRHWSGPLGLVQFCEHRLAVLEAVKRECSTRAERRPINRHMHQMRQILKLATARVRKQVSPADLGLIEEDDLPAHESG